MSTGTSFALLTDTEKIARLRYAMDVLASWLVEAQTGFGEHDARALGNLVEYGQTTAPLAPSGGGGE